MLWSDRTPREKALIVVFVFVLCMVTCGKVLGAEVQGAEPIRPPEGKLCFVDGELESWLAGAKNIPLANIPADVRARVGVISGVLERLCADEERLARVDDRERLGWLLQADSQCEYLSDTLRATLESPQTTASRKHLVKLASHVAHLQSVVREFRFLHGYSRVEIREKEVVRTIQVPGQCPRCPDLSCPDVPQCPQVPQGPSEADIAQARRDEARLSCYNNLRGSVIGWQRTLGVLGNAAPPYDVSGGVQRLASSVNECIRYGQQVECEDSLASRAESWHAQLEGIIQADNRSAQKASTIIRSQLDSMEVDLSVRLRACRGRR